MEDEGQGQGKRDDRAEKNVQQKAGSMAEKARGVQASNSRKSRRGRRESGKHGNGRSRGRGRGRSKVAENRTTGKIKATNGIPSPPAVHPSQSTTTRATPPSAALIPTRSRNKKRKSGTPQKRVKARQNISPSEKGKPVDIVRIPVSSSIRKLAQLRKKLRTQQRTQSGASESMSNTTDERLLSFLSLLPQPLDLLPDSARDMLDFINDCAVELHKATPEAEPLLRLSSRHSSQSQKTVLR